MRGCRAVGPRGRLWAALHPTPILPRIGGGRAAPVVSRTTQITMVTSQGGWAESARGLWRITAGGRQWRIQHLPPPPVSRIAAFTASAAAGLWMLTAQKLWVARPSHWQDVGTPPAVDPVQFQMVTTTQGWNLGFQRTRGAFSLWHTTDGGRQWSRVLLPLPARPVNSSPMKGK